MDDERQKQWKEGTDEAYRAIGEFVVKFEHVCHAVQLGITTILENAGIQDQRVSHVVVAGLTAEPLRTLFESLFSQTQTPSDVEKKMLKNALNRFQELTKERNDVVHGMWTVGWGSDDTTDFSEVHGHKRHKNASGAVFKQFKKKPSDFGKLSQEADALSAIFLRMVGCLGFGSSIEKNLVLSTDGHVSVPPKE